MNSQREYLVLHYKKYDLFVRRQPEFPNWSMENHYQQLCAVEGQTVFMTTKKHSILLYYYTFFIQVHNSG